MPERSLLRIGGTAAVVGAILGLVANVLHPRTSELDNPEAFLQLVAGSSIWVADHFAIVIAILIALAGQVAIHRSITTEPGVAWSRLAVAAALIGATVSVVLIASDGVAAKAAATAWVNAPEAAKPAALGAAMAIEQFNFALFSLLIFVYFGLTILLYGLAIVTSGAYPRWLGWVAVLDGIASGAVGLVQATQGVSVLVTNVLFPTTSIIATLWLLVMGLALRRKAAAPVMMREPVPGTR